MTAISKEVRRNLWLEEGSQEEEWYSQAVHCDTDEQLYVTYSRETHQRQR